MVNNVLNVNPPIVNGVFAEEHITAHGSDWLWTVFCIFSLSTLVFLFMGLRKPQGERIFHYITAGITAVASVAYFSMASDLGFVPINVEFPRTAPVVAGTNRQIFYARYVDWAITTPLLLLDLLLTAGLPWPEILFTILADIAMIVTGLMGALVSTRYKWGYFSIGCGFFFYIVYVLLVPARRHANAMGKEVSKAFNACGVVLLVLWFVYPIGFGVCEGGNVISSDSEMVFYGVLDVLAKTGFGALLLFFHRKIDPATLGLHTRKFKETTKSHDEKTTNGASAGIDTMHTGGTTGTTLPTHTNNTTGPLHSHDNTLNTTAPLHPHGSHTIGSNTTTV